MTLLLQTRALFALPLLLAGSAAQATSSGHASLPPAPEHAGAAGGNGLALRAAKLLVLPASGDQVIDHGVVLVQDGRIRAVGRADEVAIPAGYELLDVGERWLMPGMVELHNHIGSGQALLVNDLNDMVYLANPGLRASAGVRPQNPLLRRGVAGGVTTALYIPGSGTNMGGQGVLLKLGLEHYEEMEVRNPGSLKLAQAGNPERWCFNPGRSFMNWDTRHVLKRGIAYAKRWQAFERGEGSKPEVDVDQEVFRDLVAKRTQISVHTQIYQVVLMTVTMLSEELGFDAYIDHGCFDAFRAAPYAKRAGVAAILGPRAICPTYSGFIDTDGKILGHAAEFQRRGFDDIGFNTDCVDHGIFITPPQEELSVQAAMGVRYGLDNSALAAVRGVTIIPARTAGLGERVGSLEPGKDADILVVTGDPADPRTVVEKVFTNGRVVYDSATEPRRW